MPGILPDEPGVVPPGRLHPNGEEEDGDAQDSDGETENSSWPDAVTPPDYLNRLGGEGEDVQGMVHSILEIFGELWEEGCIELVATLVAEFWRVEDGEMSATQCMAFVASIPARRGD